MAVIRRPQGTQELVRTLTGPQQPRANGDDSQSNGMAPSDQGTNSDGGKAGGRVDASDVDQQSGKSSDGGAQHGIRDQKDGGRQGSNGAKGSKEAPKPEPRAKKPDFTPNDKNGKNGKNDKERGRQKAQQPGKGKAQVNDPTRGRSRNRQNDQTKDKNRTTRPPQPQAVAAAAPPSKTPTLSSSTPKSSPQPPATATKAPPSETPTPQPPAAATEAPPVDTPVVTSSTSVSSEPPAAATVAPPIDAPVLTPSTSASSTSQPLAIATEAPLLQSPSPSPSPSPPAALPALDPAKSPAPTPVTTPQSAASAAPLATPMTQEPMAALSPTISPAPAPGLGIDSSMELSPMLSQGAIAGIAFGVIFFVGIFAAIAVWLLKKSRRGVLATQHKGTSARAGRRPFNPDPEMREKLVDAAAPVAGSTDISGSYWMDTKNSPRRETFVVAQINSVRKFWNGRSVWKFISKKGADGQPQASSVEINLPPGAPPFLADVPEGTEIDPVEQPRPAIAPNSRFQRERLLERKRPHNSTNPRPQPKSSPRRATFFRDSVPGAPPSSRSTRIASRFSFGLLLQPSLDLFNFKEISTSVGSRGSGWSLWFRKDEPSTGTSNRKSSVASGAGGV